MLLTLFLSSFLNTFIGAVMVTLFSGWSFLFRSSRVEMATTLDSLARQYGDVLTVCTGRLDYETLTEESLAEAPLVAGRVAALAAPVAQLEALLADVQIEPSLWRAPVREDQVSGKEKRNPIFDELFCFAVARSDFHVQENLDRTAVAGFGHAHVPARPERN